MANLSGVPRHPYPASRRSVEDINANLLRAARMFSDAQPSMAEMHRALMRVRDSLSGRGFSWASLAAKAMHDRGVPLEEALRRILSTRERFTHLRPH